MEMPSGLDDFHRNLCRRFTQIAMHRDNEPCAHCGKPKSQHPDHDPRCSIDALSRKYVAENHDEELCVTKTLRLLEEIATINGWKFA